MGSFDRKLPKKNKPGNSPKNPTKVLRKIGVLSEILVCGGWFDFQYSMFDMLVSFIFEF